MPARAIGLPRACGEEVAFLCVLDSCPADSLGPTPGGADRSLRAASEILAPLACLLGATGASRTLLASLEGVLDNNVRLWARRTARGASTAT